MYLIGVIIFERIMLYDPSHMASIAYVHVKLLFDIT